MAMHTKLNQIYAAIDAYQFGRAVKLASALPDSNVLGKALLAHSYTHSGQKDKALVTLHKILIGDGPTASSLSTVFFEIESRLERQNAGLDPSASAASSSAHGPKSDPTPSTRKGKKGKKKPAPQQQQQQQHSTAAETKQPQQDLVDRLDIMPSAPEKIDFLSDEESTTKNISKIITDETTLATLAISLKSLNLPFTAYQMYARAANASPSELLLTKTFAFGLLTLAAPCSWDQDSHSRLEAHVLGHMQTVALHLARAAVASGDGNTLMIATAWACQSAVWQLEWLPDDDRRSSILPRLAESMGKKLLQQENDKNERSREIRMLCLRILKRQAKWDEILQILEDMPTDDNTGEESEKVFGVAMNANQIKLEMAGALKHLDRYDDARTIYEDLLDQRPDDWSCWKAHLECSLLAKSTNSVDATRTLANKVIKEQEGSRFQLRGPHLMLLEIAKENFRKDSTDGNLQALGSAVQQYAEIFAHRANSTITDLDHYLTIILRQSTTTGRDITVSLLDFTESLRKSNSSIGATAGEDYCKKEHKRKLTAFIFSLKLCHRLLSVNNDLAEKYLPDWVEIIKEWQATFSLSEGNQEGQQILKELEPGDDLILLVVQQLLCTNDSDKNGGDENVMLSAILLEAAIKNSPCNAYLRFLAMDVFHRLDAATRSWEHYQKVGLKNIQFDSCSFVVYPYLFEGGLYNEAIAVSKELLRFHAGAVRDCGDFSAKAMSSGTLTKANEFMLFQREKMNQSLTYLYSKGLTLDAAPLLATEVQRMKHDEKPVLKGGIGTMQGIVGGTEDMERATKMVVESHNKYAALSIVSDVTKECGEDLADNRDRSILTHVGFLWKPKVEKKQLMVIETLRRGHIHGLLIRATLCLGAMKGPKKGKVVKTSDLLEKRTQSLLDSVLAASEFFDNELADVCGDSAHQRGCRKLLHVFLSLCRLLSIVNAGLPKPNTGNDSMEQREHRSVDIIQNEVLVNLKEGCQKLLPISSPKLVGTLLPAYILPIFAMFRMSSHVCNAYGWGKRKATKKVSVAMAELSKAFQVLLKDNLKPCLDSLPSSETESSSSSEYSPVEEVTNLLGAEVIVSTKNKLNAAQYRTRMRMEPILDEMIDFLHEFDATREE
eukprot:CAMPEP_0172369888 /NCGR_PEP_ID=MMETSP1060-20121228/35085_1 /TAXON_ID=37318 /ORGANISM="Pseudo-nitzschia pungens, Strain cf. cingulata" /LENGTH=1118 /DNA_ID=CAMNT_0013094977 /DNA_START=142 /DNA_END=3498 /DNA_ORIENTATION=-